MPDSNSYIIRLELKQMRERLALHGITEPDYDEVVKISSEVFQKSFSEATSDVTAAERIGESTELSLNEGQEIVLSFRFSSDDCQGRLRLALDEVPIFVNGLTAIPTKQVSLEQLLELPSGSMLRVIGETLTQSHGRVSFFDHNGFVHDIPSSDLTKALVAMTQLYKQVASRRSYYLEKLRDAH